MAAADSTISDVVVQGAREHNLRDVDLVLPRNQLICFTGVSGSGKSSLAFDTLYAEGQRRYVESLSSFARQFLGQMPKPDVDLIAGLSPSISISQKTGGQNPRSTVGTITEIYDYLRVLYARVGKGHCPKCDREVTAQTREQIIRRIASLPAGTRFMVLAPLVRRQKGEYRDLFEDLLKQGFVRARVDGSVVALADNLQLDRQMRHNIEVVVDRLTAEPEVRARLAEAVESALRMGQGNLIVAPDAGAPTKAKTQAAGSASRELTDDLVLSAEYACTHCDLSFEPPSPQMFSFNSPQGMCPECHGLGEVHTFDPSRLIPDPTKSFQQGCIEPVGRWRDLGRWRRHVYRGVADTLERKHGLPEGILLETAWEELDPAFQDALLWGTGDEHVTYTWRQGPSGHKWGGKYEGVIPKLLSKYRELKSRVHRRALERFMTVLECNRCGGHRLNPQARAVTLTTRSADFQQQPGMSLPEISNLPVDRAVEFFGELELDDTGQLIAVEVLKEIRGRLGFLGNVGLSYLTLGRRAPTLSGGEMQRIRLAGQIGCGLVGVLYILDEPSIGLHPRDNHRLLDTLGQLRDQGNTVVVVEHDEDTMRAADHIVDFGPGPGVRGGEVVAAGPVETIIAQKRSVTGQYLSGRRRIEVPEVRRSIGNRRLIVRKATHNNLKGIDFDIPLGALVCVTGASGSGKSSLVNDILVEALRRDLNAGIGFPGAHEKIEGLEHLDKMIAIDQSPIGRTPRSNPATYIKVFDEIRRLFTQLPEAKTRGYKPGRFSFNVAGGRCEACEGNGSNRLEMDFLADIWMTCPVCEGHRFNRETLQVRFKGKSIAQVLEMDVQEALEHFENIPKIRHKLQTLHDVGLDYVKLGQPSPTLSGGEAQRIKLARELAKKSTGQTLYLLDEPTTGLHFADIHLLLQVLHNFVDAGNTVLVVEHNLEVVKTADWVIDLGPDGGEGGGRIVATGTPEQVARTRASYTGQALRPLLPAITAADGNGRALGSEDQKTPKIRRKPQMAKAIKVRGAQQHNLKNIDVEIPRDEMTVFCGPSGSGKSSLAMDTIYAEGQRRYVESLSSYARQFVGQMQKPKLEHIEGLSPAIAIEQKRAGNTPRSTVGTVTEVYDYLRILMARLGEPYCPDCDIPIGTQSADEVIAKILDHADGTRLFVMAPLELHVGEQYETLWEELRAGGYVRIRVDSQTYSIDEMPRIDRRRKHTVEVVVDRMVIRPDARRRVGDSVENALALGRGVLRVAYPRDDVSEPRWVTKTHSQHYACDRCGRSFDPLSPHNFSFNSSLGWCEECEGLGTQLGANPAALLRDGKLTLAEGAVALWPATDRPVFAAMLGALSGQAGLAIDVPLDQLNARQRRLVMHGTADQWFEVHLPTAAGAGKKGSKPVKKTSAKKTKKTASPAFRFQYKGLYPALEEASRTSPSLRGRLEHLVDEVECSTCGGSRLRDDASAVRLDGRTIDELCRFPLEDLLDLFRNWQLTGTQRQVAGEVFREIRDRLQFLVDVGLEYLTLARPAPTLSGGEAQRIRLAAQIGSGLCGVLYVLDEPTIGLHPRDTQRLLDALARLRDLGNTLLVVEHDRDVVKGADRLLDFGPGAGRHGGQIVAQGTPDQVARRRASVTGPYLSGKKAIPVPTNRRMPSVVAGASGKKTKTTATAVHPPGGGWLEVLGARHNNLKNVDLAIPLGTFTAITGPSGSGKSSLIDDVLYNTLARTLHRAKLVPAPHDRIRGIEQINKVIRVDQQALGNTPTSNAATYTGVFELIRTLFAQLPEAKLRGYLARRFSFNVAGGRCEKCEGNGQLCVEMHFLADVWVECDTCRGKRYNPETLAVRYHGKSIADVLEMSCGEAAQLMAAIPKIRRTLQTLCDVGLDYLKLGQPAPTLSGGEAQRVKLAAELSRPDTGRTLYLLDEPTTGLHFTDLVKLLEVLNRLVDLGNTVVVIEHNLDVVKTADWVIDLGPEAGAGGGYIVAGATPEDLIAHARKARPKTKTKRKSASLHRSHTGEALEAVLEAGPHKKRKTFDFAAEAAARAADLDITAVGEGAKMPWEIDGRRWHTAERVGRNGRACRWDGRVLAEVVDRIHEMGEFSATEWNSRSVVEIRAPKKSDGWFFHAITGEEWLLKMKFRTAKNTFHRDELIPQLALKPLNEMDELPVYGIDPRTRCKNLHGPWQEVEVRVHNHEEIDRPEFWRFVDDAVAGFDKFTQRVAEKPEDLMPWKVLGRKWHLMRKGFPSGSQVGWKIEVLEALCTMLQDVAPGGEFVWGNKQLVNFAVPGPSVPWACLLTKKTDAVHLLLTGPKGRFALGSVTDLGYAPELDGENLDCDVFHFRFRSVEEVAEGKLRRFLEEHFVSLRRAAS